MATGTPTVKVRRLATATDFPRRWEKERPTARGRGKLMPMERGKLTDLKMEKRWHWVKRKRSAKDSDWPRHWGKRKPKVKGWPKEKVTARPKPMVRGKRLVTMRDWRKQKGLKMHWDLERERQKQTVKLKRLVTMRDWRKQKGLARQMVKNL